MSVTGIVPIDTNNSGELLLEKGARNYVRSFLVATSTPADGPEVILAYSGGPAIGWVYVSENDSDPAAFCVRKSAQRLATDPTKFQLDCHYSTRTPPTWDQVPNPSDPFNSSGNTPEDRPARFALSHEKYQVTVYKDYVGRAIVNSAGQPFENLLTINRSRQKLTVTVFRTSFNYVYITDIQDCTNSDTWGGFPPNTLIVDNVDVRTVSENNLNYNEITYEIIIDWRGANPVYMLDQGYYEYYTAADTSNGTVGATGLRQIRDTRGTPITAPALLNGQGKVLPNGYSPVFRPFIAYNIISFAAIP